MSAVLKATHYGRKLLGRELRSDGPEDLHLSSYISYGLNMAAVKPGKPIPGVETLTKVRSCSRAFPIVLQSATCACDKSCAGVTA